jgi:hypothetical protein
MTIAFTTAILPSLGVSQGAGAALQLCPGLPKNETMGAGRNVDAGPV